MQVYTCKYIDMSHPVILFVHTIISIIFACIYTGPHSIFPSLFPMSESLPLYPFSHSLFSNTCLSQPASRLQCAHHLTCKRTKNKQKIQVKSQKKTCIRAAMRTSSDVLDRNTHPPLPEPFSEAEEAAGDAGEGKGEGEGEGEKEGGRGSDS